MDNISENTDLFLFQLHVKLLLSCYKQVPIVLPPKQMTNMFWRLVFLSESSRPWFNSNALVLAEDFFLFSHCLFGCILSIICCARKCHCELHCVKVPLRSLQRWPEHSHVSFWRRSAPDGPLLCLRPAREPHDTISREVISALCHLM